MKPALNTYRVNAELEELNSVIGIKKKRKIVYSFWYIRVYLPLN